MRAVGTRELKNRLSEYLRMVRAGEEVLVTDRGVVVAELCPPRRLSVPTTSTPAFDDLVRRGLASSGLPNSPAAYPSLPRAVAPGAVRRLLDEEREDR